MSRFPRSLACLLPLVLITLPPGITEAGRGPHGNPDDCEDCHEDEDEDGRYLPADDEACSDCHDGEEPHAMGVRSTHTKIPADWPLQDGLLGCITCHDEPACDGLPVDPANQARLRGGPYTVLTQFCARCHNQNTETVRNPHKEMAEPGDARPTVCRVCHTGDPVAGGDVLDTCLPCHEKMSYHVGSIEHMLVSADEVAHITAAAKAAGLPLPDRRIACVTCHDPHPVGIIEGRTAPRLAPAAPKAVQETIIDVFFSQRHDQNGAVLKPPRGKAPLLRLGADGSALCRACHGAGGRPKKKR